MMWLSYLGRLSELTVRRKAKARPLCIWRRIFSSPFEFYVAYLLARLLLRRLRLVTATTTTALSTQTTELYCV